MAGIGAACPALRARLGSRSKRLLDERGEASMITTEEAAEAPVRRRVTRLASNLNVRNIGAVYVWIALIVIFAIWKPDLFPTARTAKTTLNEYAITGLAALS